MRHSRPIRSAGPFEYGMWLFTRFSGLALMLFAAITMGAAFVLGGRTLIDMPAMFRWMFFPNPNHVVNTDIPDVSLGWSNATWQIFATLMIFMAAGHAYNGLRMVLEDYIKRPLLVAFLRVFVFMLWLGSMILAIYVILAS